MPAGFRRPWIPSTDPIGNRQRAARVRAERGLSLPGARPSSPKSLRHVRIYLLRIICICIYKNIPTPGPGEPFGCRCRSEKQPFGGNMDNRGIRKRAMQFRRSGAVQRSEQGRSLEPAPDRHERFALILLRFWLVGRFEGGHSDWQQAWTLASGSRGPAVGRRLLRSVEAVARCWPNGEQASFRPPYCPILSDTEILFIEALRSASQIRSGAVSHPAGARLMADLADALRGGDAGGVQRNLTPSDKETPAGR